MMYDKINFKPIDQSSVLDVLASMDYKLQILPILASILEHNAEKNFSELDLRMFHTKIRMYSALEQSFAGSNWNDQKSTIQNTQITRFFFNNRVQQHSLGTGFLNNIFDPLYKMSFFTDPPPIPKGTKEIMITKNVNKITSRPKCVEPISDLLNLPVDMITINRNTRLLCNFDPSQSNHRIYERRIEETCELYKILRNQNQNYLQIFTDNKSFILDGIDSITSFPYVGTVEDKEHSGKTVIFFLSSFHFVKESTIDDENIRFQIKTFFENILKNPDINLCINKCASIDQIADSTRQTYHPRNPSFFWTLFVQVPDNPNRVYTISFLSFFTSPTYIRSNSFILAQAMQYIQKYLKWNSRLSLGDYSSVNY